LILREKNWPVFCISFWMQYTGQFDQFLHQGDIAMHLPKDLDLIAGAARATFQVPGMAITVVDGDETEIRCYGVRDLRERKHYISEFTLFNIGSNTKLFTAVAIGILVEAGLLAWDEPVVRYLPWFRLNNPRIGARLTVRQLLAHCSGHSPHAGDLLWYPTTKYTRREIAERFADVPMIGTFGNYAYNNVCYIVAGELIKEVSGLSWEDFITSRIFKPIGMTTSIAAHSARAPYDRKKALGHQLSGNEAMLTWEEMPDSNNPAGGIWAPACDMALWMQVILNNGRLQDGSRLYSQQTAAELTRVVTVMPVGLPPAYMQQLVYSSRGYALGIEALVYQDQLLLAHNGWNSVGHSCRMVLIPALHFGVLVCTNMLSTGGFSVPSFHIVDAKLRAPRVSWIRAWKTYQEEAAARTAQAIKPVEEVLPPENLQPYLGTYRDSWYGSATITLQGTELLLQFDPTRKFIGRLAHIVGDPTDRFYIRWLHRSLQADDYIIFSRDGHDTVMAMRFEGALPTDIGYNFDLLSFIRV
jgi:CubicO group peptidase (beta-lactamase class C family)